MSITDSYEFRGFTIPNYMMAGIRRYIKKGIPPGDFLRAVICNDLTDAVSRADDVNLYNLPAYAGYFYNEAPGNCWGSREKMEKWIAKFADAECMAKENDDEQI